MIELQEPGLKSKNRLQDPKIMAEKDCLCMCMHEPMHSTPAMIHRRSGRRAGEDCRVTRSLVWLVVCSFVLSFVVCLFVCLFVRLFVCLFVGS